MASRRQIKPQPRSFQSDFMKSRFRAMGEVERIDPYGGSLKSYYKQAGISSSDPVIKRTEKQISSRRADTYLRQKARMRPDSDTQKIRGAAIVAGTAAAAYGGYQAYQHRGEIKAKAHLAGDHLQNAFHSTRSALGA